MNHSASNYYKKEVLIILKTDTMGNTGLNKTDGDDVFKTELIDVLARFSNEYEESLAMVLKNEDANEIIYQNFIENNFDEDQSLNILSLWEKLKKNKK